METTHVYSSLIGWTQCTILCNTRQLLSVVTIIGFTTIMHNYMYTTEQVMHTKDKKLQCIVTLSQNQVARDLGHL